MRISVSTREHYNTGPYESIEICATVEVDTIADQDTPTADDLRGQLDYFLAPLRDRVHEVSSNSNSMIFHPAFESA